ncbi:MAG: tetratricopeptide repeat protein, partial [Chloroflexota bacterium]
LPLALELAAARTRLFPLAVLRDEIKASQLAWLADNKFQRPSRQQTLRGALDWSYRLLEPEEQKLFCRLALFAGGFGLETARAVTSPSLDLMLVANLAQNRCVTNYAVAFPGLNLMLLLESLLTRSLLKLVATTDGTNRYKMLQVTREYALEKFAEQSESIAVGWQFALYFINWTKEVVPKLNGPHQRAMLHKLETEHANLRAILDYALEHKIADIALSLSGILLDFWEVGGHWSEGCNYLSRTLALDSSDFAGQAMCKKALGLLLQDLGDYTESLKWLEQAQVNFETLNDSLNLSQTRRWMGHFYARKNQMATAQKLAESSLELAQQEQDRLAIANTLNLLGRIALYQSNFEQARDFCEKSLALQRELENPSGIFRAVNQLGIIAHRQGDYESALAFFTGALNISQDLVNKRLISNSTSSLGWVYLSSGEYGLAIAAFLKALVLQRELGDKTNCAVSLNNLGKLTELQGNFEQARRYGEDSVLLYRELGDKQGFSYALNNLGVTLHRQQDFGRAQLLYEESILLKREAGDRWALAYTLTRCSLLLCQQGQYPPALRVLQESLELLQQIKSLEEIANGLLVLAVIAFALKQPQIAFQLNCLSLNVLAESRTGKFEPLFQTDYEKLADTLALENGAEHNLTLEQTVEFALNTLQVLVKNEPSHI